MHRFYLAPKEWNAASPALDEGDSHHAVNVLRFTVGDWVTVFDGDGAEARAKIISLAGSRIQLRMSEKHRSQPLRCAITLAQAIPKGRHMEFIIQKATELGASRIAPLLSDRTVIQLDLGDAEKKRQRWLEVAIEACKQCGQNRVPEIVAPRTPKAFFENQEQIELMLIAATRCPAHKERSGRLSAAAPRLRADRARRRFHTSGACPGKEQRMPANNAWAHHSARRNRRTLLSKRFGTRVVLSQSRELTSSQEVALTFFFNSYASGAIEPGRRIDLVAGDAHCRAC